MAEMHENFADGSNWKPQKFPKAEWSSKKVRRILRAKCREFRSLICSRTRHVVEGRTLRACLKKAVFGSTGYQPVPSGNLPDGMGAASMNNPGAGFQCDTRSHSG